MTDDKPPEEWGEAVMREMLDYVRGIYGREPTLEEAQLMYWAWAEEVERLYETRPVP